MMLLELGWMCACVGLLLADCVNVQHKCLCGKKREIVFISFFLHVIKYPTRIPSTDLIYKNVIR